LVAALCERLEVAPARLCFDSYYRPLGHLQPAVREQENFDHPDSLDARLFAAHLDALIDGDSVAEPVYDFARHDRSEQSRKVTPAGVIVVDGILLFHWPELVSRLDWRVFVECDPATRLSRRLARDVMERGRSEASVRAQFEATVAPMHRRFVEPSAALAQRRVAGAADLDSLADELCAELSQRLAEFGAAAL
tara:strand:+ start:181 stop:759 length:579 start_codon:yes stop_codon:yes gene_type:complete